MSGESGDAVTFSLFRSFKPMPATSWHLSAKAHPRSQNFRISSHVISRSVTFTMSRVRSQDTPLVVKLRNDVWESIFTLTWNAKRSLYRRMQEIPTLITGPSGTGKELVAQAIGLSRYIPFDEERTTFARPFDDGFYYQPHRTLGDTLRNRTLWAPQRFIYGCPQDRVGFIGHAGALDRYSWMKSATYL